MEQDNQLSTINTEAIFNPIPQKRGTLAILNWISMGWSLLKGNMLAWFIITYFYFIISLSSVAFTYIPIIGHFIFIIVMLILISGLIKNAEQKYHNKPLKLKYLFWGFRKNNCISMTFAYIIGILLFFIVAINIIVIHSLIVLSNSLIIESNFLKKILENDLATIIFTSVIITLSSFIFTLIYSFISSLIIIEGYKAIPAIKTSFIAVKKNFISILLYYLFCLIITIMTIITLGFGLFITVPLSMTVLYSAYRDIFYQVSSENPNHNITVKTTVTKKIIN